MKKQKKLLIAAAIIVCAGLLLIGCNDEPKNNDNPKTPDTDAVVSIDNISGVTAPAFGANPATTITGTDQYTGSTAWFVGEDPFTGSTFAAETVYTAIITLIPKQGFTFKGVAKDFFKVSGATATNPADSGVVTAVFPETGAAPVPPPELPVLFENGQWAEALGDVIVHTPGGASTWAYEDGLIRIHNGVPTSRNIAFRFVFDNVVDMRGYNAVFMELDAPPASGTNPNVFAGQLRFRIDQDAAWSINTAGVLDGNVIKMTRGTSDAASAAGFPGLGAANWDLEKLRGVGGLPASGQTVKIKRIYLGDKYDFQPVTINARNILDIIPPRTGNTPVKEITTSNQYSGTVAWEPNHATFQAGETYTATITLTAREGWTLSGVTANWFQIFNPTGTSNGTTHTAGSDTITKTFPATTAIEQYPPITRYVAFSFDDTPSSSTNALLDVIESLGGDHKFTFFVSGVNLERAKPAHPLYRPDFKEAMDRIIAGGHEIANHAWQHERYDDSADEDVTRENFKKNHDLIIEFAGKPSQWSRIPYASHGTMSLRVAGEFGMSNLRGLATNDWDLGNSASFLVNRILTVSGTADGLGDGQIYVSHDQPGQTNTRQALPEIVHELQSRGYGFKTVSELREHMDRAVLPGVNYQNFKQQ